MANPLTPATTVAATTQTEPVLKDIHLADDPSFWPPAVGWWILLTVILVALTAAFRWLKASLNKKRQHEKQREILLNELSILETQLARNPSNKAIAAINTLLRQYAVNFYPRSKIASLTGSDWLNFLDESGNTKGFTQGAGRILIEAPYQRSALENLNQDEFITLIRKWVSQLIRHQKPPQLNGGQSQ